MFKNMKPISFFLACVFASLAFSTASAADLIMTAPPRETPEAGKKIYQPLARHLSKLLKTKVVYKHPRNWLNYQREMRAGKYDIVFDGPHFISWRVAHLENHVLARLPGTLEFYLIAKKGDNEINSVDDLIGKQICGISPPNLSTLAVLDNFRNPVRQPVIQGIKGGMGKVYKAFKGGACRAAVVRSTFYKKKLKDQDRAQIKIIMRSKPLPNQGVTVSRRINASARSRILESLTIGDGVKASNGILKRFGGKKAKSFIPTKNGEYEGINQLLEGVIFGW